MGWRDKLTGSSNDDPEPSIDYEAVNELTQNASGYGVTQERLTEQDNLVLDALDDGEQPHHILHGTGLNGIQVQTGDDVKTTGIKGAGISETLNFKGGSYNLTVATDTRVLALMRKEAGVDEYSIPYDSIASVSLDRGTWTRNIQLATTGQTYLLEVHPKEDGNIQDVVTFIREKRDAAARQASTVDAEDEEESPLDKLERLSELKEQGVVSDAEFEEKKQELMDQI